MMSEKPILFSGPMVRAILDGKKTQTRRVIKKDVMWNNGEYVEAVDVGLCKPLVYPYHKGDTLWVREAFQYDTSTIYMNGRRPVVYRATDEKDGRGPYGARWKPSIHMPKWACRLRLKVEHVQIEQLQAISEDDARAEGVSRSSSGVRNVAGCQTEDINHRITFAKLWDEINAARGYSWNSNPWVWVVKFSVVENAC